MNSFSRAEPYFSHLFHNFHVSRKKLLQVHFLHAHFLVTMVTVSFLERSNNSLSTNKGTVRLGVLLCPKIASK